MRVFCGHIDIVHNQGYVYLGNSYDTPEFAAHAIAQWWADPARPRFPHEDKLLILCDAGGSNNCRSWLWKAELQRQCADRFGISVLVCHYPTGASKIRLPLSQCTIPTLHMGDLSAAFADCAMGLLGKHLLICFPEIAIGETGAVCKRNLVP